MSDLKISVVIPAYNASEWIHDCVKSILEQRPAPESFDLPEFEVIVVDDGSRDATADIVKSLCDDYRVKLIRQTNMGVSAARNAGIKAARGEYICFVDSDDMLRHDAFATLWYYIRKFGHDTIVVPGECYSGLAKNWNEHEIAKKDYAKGYKVLTGLKAVEECLYRRELEPDMHGALIPRDLFDENSMFRPGRYEDLDLFYRLYEKVSKVVILKAPLYFYRDHDGSFINNFSLERLHALTVTERIYQHYKSTPMEPAAIDRRISACFNMLIFISQHINGKSGETRETLSEAESRIWEIMKKYRRQTLLNKKGRFINKPALIISYFGKPVLKKLLLLGSSKRNS